jgi:hypothetical protein
VTSLLFLSPSPCHLIAPALFIVPIVSFSMPAPSTDCQLSFYLSAPCSHLNSWHLVAFAGRCGATPVPTEDADQRMAQLCLRKYLQVHPCIVCALPRCSLTYDIAHSSTLHCGIVLNDENYVWEEVRTQLGLATRLLADLLTIPAQRYGPHYAVLLTTPNPQNRIMESGVSQGASLALSPSPVSFASLSLPPVPLFPIQFVSCPV